MYNDESQNDIRLVEFAVKRLFGEFDHLIPLSVDDRVTALIGPNGLGKTACLKLIFAFFRNQWSTFATTEFEEVGFAFSNGWRVNVTKNVPEDASTAVSDALGINVSIIDGEGERIESWTPRSLDESAVRPLRFDHYLPFLTRTAARQWTHDTSGITYSVQEVIDVFGQHLPEAMLSGFKYSPPKSLAGIIGAVDCHLIETQRLLVFQNEDGRRSSSSGSLAISRKAQLLKSIIAKELGLYASTSQSLDRSFPRRVLEGGAIIPSHDLTAQLSELDSLRQRLTKVGILDEEEEAALPEISFSDSAIASVLSVYVDDTRHKLKVLDALQSKIHLFINLINERFYPKYVEVGKSNGFSVKRSDKIVVPLEKLSSGEQHQLVLFFELLFELKDNALILLDEPELSLHVGWQRQFVADLKKIIELNCFDVVLATHSPQLIGEWQEIVVELGDVDPQ